MVFSILFPLLPKNQGIKPFHIMEKKRSLGELPVECDIEKKNFKNNRHWQLNLISKVYMVGE